MVGVPGKKTTRAVLLALPALLMPLAAAAQEAEPTALDPLVVDSEEGDLVEAETTTATKTDTPVIEIPQSISTIPRAQLDELNPQSVRDALNYTSGVLSSTETTSRYDSIFLRGFGGFGTTTNVVDFLDGLKLPRGQAFALPQVDPFLLERIDVLKGPSALLYGQTTPGGLVNQVSRLPTDLPYREARIEGGSYGRIQGGFTGQGAIDEEGTLQYSLTGFGRYSGTRYDDVEESRVALAPIVAWQPDADTRVTLQGFFQDDPQGGYFNSIYPQFLSPSAYRSDLGPRVNVGDPDFDSFDRQQYGIGYGLEHRFNDAISASSAFRYSAIDLDMQSLQMVAPMTADGIIPRAAVRSDESVWGIAADNRAQADFATGPLVHETILGVDVQYSVSDWAYSLGAAPSLNVADPQYGQPIGPLMTLIDNQQTLQQVGLYLQDQVSFDRLHAVLGVRHDWTSQETQNRLSDSDSDQSSGATSYRAGLLYLFDSGVAPYFSYSTSFEPVIGVDVNGDPFVPTEAQQWEVGIKYEPSFIDALFTVSAFTIRQENVLTPGPVVGFNVQEGEVRSRGLEFEARGNLTRNIQLIGALTLLDTEVTQSNVSANVGKRPQAVPDYFGSVWGSYVFDSGALDGLLVGTGVRYVGSSYADDANTVRTPGYVLVDMAVSYELGALAPALEGTQLTVNVTNLFDKQYYASCTYGYYCQWGNGAEVVAGLRYSW